ncbi:hypothetical protein N39L_61390 [Limnospira platensis NIES-39]|uniref:Uncharacterized protein n=1 Tax=Limnospira platensis NIES-46 TaxID=1236695 RepID=A0A5M3T0H1_LIMPL|nr:hypothetical protein N39L_61390 [Arthrospira platensis NIES-39]GCE93093.1 hypothetical protein NIES46_11420 [Arthrospira platensis NIES-46]
MITERAVNYLGWGDCLTPPPHRQPFRAIGVGGVKPPIYMSARIPIL